MTPTDKNSEQIESILRRKMAQGAGASETAQCPEPNLLAAYYERALPAGESEKLEGHLTDCPRCQLMLATIARADPAVDAAEKPAIARWLTGWRIAVPALAAAVLIVVVMQAMRPRQAELENQQIASLEKKAEKDKLTPLPQMPAAPAAPAPSSIGALAMNEPKRAAVAGQAVGLRSDFTRAPEAKTDTLAKAEAPERAATLAKEKPAQPYSGAASGLGGVASAPAAEPVAPSPAGAQLSDQRAMGTSQSVAGAASGGNLLRGWKVGRLPDPGYTFVPGPDELIESWEVGPGGKLGRSVGGSTYVAQNSGVTADLLAGAAPSRDVCWVVGRAGTVLRTTDGGAHWAKTAAPTDGDLAGVSADSASHAVVVAADGGKFATSDAGATWQAQ